MITYYHPLRPTITNYVDIKPTITYYVYTYKNTTIKEKSSWWYFYFLYIFIYRTGQGNQ